MVSAQTTPLPVPSWVPVWTLLLVVGIGLSVAVLLLLARPGGRWGETLRARFVLGVPWGTVLTVLGVLGTYLFVQGGWGNLRNPLVIPFRSWSYLYPLGVVTAPFTHSGLGHLTGNLQGTVIFAPLCEYAWGHFPRERGRQSFGSLGANPFVRILAVPAAVFVVGLLTGLFAVGPVIGFSGVVFAFAGFALVQYPVATVVALLAGRVLNLVYNAFQYPTFTTEARPRFITPWWADIAIQGHALGLFIGVLLGGLYLYGRSNDARHPAPSALRIWFATLVFAVSESLWALYWFRGAGKFVLFRAGGTAVVFLLGALVTAAVTASDRMLVERIDLRRREAAVGILLCLTLATSAAAVPFNLATVGEVEFENEVEVRDYRVTYAEGVPDQYVSVLNVSVFGETTQVNTSGVIVVSERRQVFRTAVLKSELAFRGRASVLVGGVGWRERVFVNRTGWRTVGNGSVYKVFVKPSGEERRLVYASEPQTVGPRIAGRHISIRPSPAAYQIVVRRRDEVLGRTRVPTAGNNVSAGGIAFNRTGNSVFALRNGTRVRIANEGGGRKERR